MSLEHPTEKTCKTCQFWDPFGSEVRGECRVSGPSRGSRKWPDTTDRDWCGRWKALEVE